MQAQIYIFLYIAALGVSSLMHINDNRQAPLDKFMGTVGYIWIGLDHFAKLEGALAQALATGCLKRNFQGHRDDLVAPLIGKGASSVITAGFCPACRAFVGLCGSHL